MPDTLGLPTPTGFSQNSIENYYQALLNPIKRDTTMQIGQAHSQALERGLEGTPTEFGGVAAANYYGGQRSDQALGNLGYQLAGLTYQGAEAKRSQESSQAFEARENALQRAYGREMAQMGYDWQGNQEATRNRWGFQSALANTPAYLAGQLLSGANRVGQAGATAPAMGG